MCRQHCIEELRSSLCVLIRFFCCSFAAAAEGQAQLEPDVSQSTDDKQFSSDTAHTETTKISDT